MTTYKIENNKLKIETTSEINIKHFKNCLTCTHINKSHSRTNCTLQEGSEMCLALYPNDIKAKILIALIEE